MTYDSKYDDNNNPTNLIAQNMQNNYSGFESRFFLVLVYFCSL